MSPESKLFSKIRVACRQTFCTIKLSQCGIRRAHSALVNNFLTERAVRLIRRAHTRFARLHERKLFNTPLLRLSHSRIQGVTLRSVIAVLDTAIPSLRVAMSALRLRSFFRSLRSLQNAFSGAPSANAFFPKPFSTNTNIFVA